MELALNYSAAAATLLAERRIRIDALRIPDVPDVLAPAGALAPVFLHFALDAGTTTSAEQDLERVAALRAAAAEAGAAHGRAPRPRERVNVQLAPSALRFPGATVDGAAPSELDAVTDVLTADVERVCRRFGADEVVVGTLIYRGPPRGLLRAGVEPAVVAEVARRCGCGLLLDLAHARLNAMALGADLWDYLDAFPVDRLRELHVSGVGLIDGRAIDHLGLAEHDLPVLEGALARVAAGAWRTPERLVFDYGGVGPAFAWRSEPTLLASQVPVLRDLLDGLSGPAPTPRSGTSPG